MYTQAQYPNSKYKTQLCRHFSLNGICALGPRCQFAHGQQELRTQNGNSPQQSVEPMAPNIQSFPPQIQKVQGLNPMITNYKTQLCKHFNPLTGQCKNGQTCTFAHGEQELNVMNPYQMNQQFMQMQAQRQMQTQQSIQSELTQQILVIILTSMESIFPNQQTILTTLRQGQEQARLGNTQGASDIIKQIIHDPERSKEEKQQYQQIYNNAQRHYEQKMKELQSQQQQQQQQQFY